MKRPILDSRRKVISAVICAYPGGRECAAARLGLELKKFDNQAYESAGHRPLADEQVHLLEQDAGTTFLPDYLSGLYGGVFVPMPEATELDNVDLYIRSLHTDVKKGAVDQIIAKALDDGSISPDELANIIEAHRQHIAARHSEVQAVVTLHTEVKA
ncbi:YmfL family putative regulatory protein [Pseudomonas sp.]|uniref:YmfL family putative regulatory protein n=1 Tax=Pseudomonas sp. TaxID=306 RepID=UPI00273529BF|nr:YmfL family putative regulatory protein [Pseudomonas sp.]MDP2747973.1 YmfL family putative regulatory protein [Pseudomonas sp.]